MHDRNPFARRPRGNPRIELARAKAIESRQAAALELRDTLRPLILELRSAGLSYREIALHLDQLGITPPRASRWSYTTIRLIELQP